MSNNRMYLVHVPSRVGIYLGKRMGWGWYDCGNADSRIGSLYAYVDQQALDQDRFEVWLEAHTHSDRFQEVYCVTQTEEIAELPGLLMVYSLADQDYVNQYGEQVLNHNEINFAPLYAILHENAKIMDENIKQPEPEQHAAEPQQERTMAHVLADAERAEAVGVPVDWKRMAYSILNTAQSELAAMDGAIKKQRAEIADLQDQLGLAD